ncbi:unnamed protein product [Alopecurus aequalis]
MGAALSSDNNNKKQAEPKPSATPAPAPPPLPPPPPPTAFPDMFGKIIAADPDSDEKNPDPAAPEGKCWVKKDNIINFMLLPKSLSITWGGDTRYWTWKPFEEGSKIEVAELKDVCWLEVDGKMELSYLTPGVVYEVVFEIMIKEVSRGWSVPVNLRLKLPYGTVQERKEHLQDKPREKWLDIPVGEIKPQKGQTGDLSISLFQFTGNWKKGLVVRGIRIAPK